jgi:tetratricopeptide (TPR) repeat protein
VARPRSAARSPTPKPGELCDNARALLDSDHPSEAIGLLESGIERAGQDPALRLRLRHLLGAALFYAGEYTRAASVLDAAGQDYRRYFPPDDPVVLDCAYYAGHAYAETGKAAKALPQLRFYVRNSGVSPGGEISATLGNVAI